MMLGIKLRRRPKALAAIEGAARVDRRTKDMIRRLEPGDIAVIDHVDLDRVAADGLIEAGVASEQVELAESESASVETALAMARPTDLVLVFCDNITRSWKQIIYFKPKEKAAPVPPEQLVAAAGFDVPEGWRILSDERGVRIVPAG